MIRPFLGKEVLQAVRSELENLNATEKETDLFRFFQTSDIAPRIEVEQKGTRKTKRRKTEGTSGEKNVPKSALAEMTDMFASEEYRGLCADITQCGVLSERVDLSAQIYAQGGHLLCHDDVIGTRMVSFIYYLSDPEGDWTAEEGGALELYPPHPTGPRGTPAIAPEKEILPLADSLVMFVVEPGVSFHAVREVLGERARVSIQGWLHAPSLQETKSFEQRSVATLQQILQNSGVGGSDNAVRADSNGDAAESHSDTVEKSLSKADIAYLSRCISAEYLKEESMEQVANQFADSSYAVLGQFLRPDLHAALSKQVSDADNADGFGPDLDTRSAIPQYTAGQHSGWKSVGPPHLQRYLRYNRARHENPDADQQEDASLGEGLSNIAEIMRSAAFRKWLNFCTQLRPKTDVDVEVRRFRPGLDYTVAACADAIAPGCAELDATLVVCPPGAREQWASEEVGGFESFLAADDDDHGGVEAQEVYRGGEDEGPLVNVPVAPNTLSLIMRDAKTLRFVKYLSFAAPSSRVDVGARYVVDAPDGSASEEDDQEGNGNSAD